MCTMYNATKSCIDLTEPCQGDCQVALLSIAVYIYLKMDVYSTPLHVTDLVVLIVLNILTVMKHGSNRFRVSFVILYLLWLLGSHRVLAEPCWWFQDNPYITYCDVTAIAWVFYDIRLMASLERIAGSSTMKVVFKVHKIKLFWGNFSYTVWQ